MPKTTNELDKKTQLILSETIDKEMLLRLLSAEEMDETLRSQLMKYYSRMNGPLVSVSYHFSRKLEDQGRLYAKDAMSLQSFKKEIRQALAKDLYYDIDMENAHPCLLSQYCEKNNIDCPNLMNYVLNREQTLQKIQEFHGISRNEAKKFLLKIQYLGSYSYEKDGKKIVPEKKFDLVLNYKNELLNIAKRVCEIEKEIHQKVLDDKDKTNKEASTLSIVCQKIEYVCLMAMYKYFKSVNISVGVLCFDGLMIKKSDKITDIEPYLQDCIISVFDQTGYYVNLVEKPMDEPLSIIIPDISNYVESDKEAQEKLFKIVGEDKFKFCNNELYIYNEITGMFDTKIEILNQYLRKYESYFLIKEGNTFNSYGRSSKLMKDIIPQVKAAALDDEWLEKKANSSLGYLLFKDGIYDMKKGEFTEGFNPDIVFFYRIPYNFPKYDKEKIKIAKKTFDSFFIDSEPMLASLSRALAGDITLKQFYICPGESNAGKSKFGEMLKNAFGGYVGNFNAENLAQSSKMDTKDEASKNRWAIKARFHRILISNEIKMKICLDGNAIKKHASGGDALVGRDLFKSETIFIPHYTIFSFLNDQPEIEPCDQAVRNRLKYIRFPYIFVEKDKLEENEMNRLTDKDFNNKIKQKDFIKGLIHLILDAYKKYKNQMPAYDEVIKEEYLGENMQDNYVIETVKQYFEITNNNKDYIPIKYFKDFIEKHIVKKGTSYTKATKLLVKELKIVNGKNNKAERAWLGIKKKDLNNVEFTDN